jgi:predicted SAM-dependent methyltransferase
VGQTVRRLQFGCGKFPAPGWINANLEPGPGVEISGDIKHGLPLESDSLQYIASMHALVELPYLEVVPALRELRRVLEAIPAEKLGYIVTGTGAQDSYYGYEGYYRQRAYTQRTAERVR